MLAEVPLVFILIGVVAYTVLAGADFGAGFWVLFPGGGRVNREDTRALARRAIGPVWEANHVWLIFVLVVCWTAYPVAYASITSTLVVPLFIAAVGIILRGATYALRDQLEAARGRRAIEDIFALSSVFTPFALGTVIGAIASGRVPVGNARGHLLTSWLNPTSITIGLLAVATSSYLASVYLTADARRLGHRALEHDFRKRALRAGVCAGAIALGGLLVVRVDAPGIWSGLTHGAGLAMVLLSASAGIATLVLLLRGSYVLLRASAALAVAAVIAGWGIAQYPWLLPGLSVSQAAAGRTTLVAVVVAVAFGAIVLVPSLALLFTLFLRGRLAYETRSDARDLGVAMGGVALPARRRVRGAFSVTGLLVGIGLTLFAHGDWGVAIGILSMFAAAAFAFVTMAVPPPKPTTITSQSKP